MPGTEREKQIQEANELLFSGKQRQGVAKGLFLGEFVADWVMPYPQIDPREEPGVTALLARLRKVLDEKVDAATIDRQADIPRSVIDELGRTGLLGMAATAEFGGGGFSQMAFCRAMEMVGAHDGSTSVFVNAHHSIGIRALVLFGTPEQQKRWLPTLATGEHLAAFALTEPEAGSDAANVQTQAKPTPDGKHYILNGQKRYITNGGIAKLLTVMARTPIPGKEETAVTAFMVTPDMPGFTVVEPRMEKLGIRGTATAKLEFHDMLVPKENILGPLGKGLKVALTVLDFGRTTFGACCTGAAKESLRLAIEHANSRRQFKRTLGEFELTKLKIGRMAADVYAMEAMTTVTAGLIDRGLEDYMLETAMLKVFTTEVLWTAVNESFQIHGGAAYFTDKPLERMLRDARINQIGEGANEVLISFIALVGMRGPGQQFQDILEGLKKGKFGKSCRLGWERLGAAVAAPDVPVKHTALEPYARQIGQLICRFSREIDRALIKHREEILERQYVQDRISRVAMKLFACACVLSRWDVTGEPDDVPALFLRSSFRGIEQALDELRDNDDGLVTAVADKALGKGPKR